MFQYLISLVKHFAGSYFKSLDLTNISDHLRISPRSCIRVGIVGGGMGGCMCSYYLSKLFRSPEDVQINIFNVDTVEKSFSLDRPLGGRTMTVKFAGGVYEIGGSVIHDANKHVCDLIAKFGLEKNQDKKDDGRMAIFDTESPSVKFRTNGWFDFIKTIWYFGLINFLTLKYLVDRCVSKFKNIYTMQNDGFSFVTVGDMLRAMGRTEYYNLMKTNATIYFQKYFNTRFINELISCGTRCNYGQNVKEMNAFAALVSCAGMDSDSLFSIKGGNVILANKCAEESNAIILNEKVVSVNFEKPWNTIVVTEGGGVYNFDVVIIACPLEEADFTLEPYYPLKKFAFHRTVATLVYGVPQVVRNVTEIFTSEIHRNNLEENESHPDFNFNSISLCFPVDADAAACSKIIKSSLAGKPAVWKIFTQQPVTKEELKLWFKFESSQDSNGTKGDNEEPENVLAVDWMAYPQFDDQLGDAYPFLIQSNPYSAGGGAPTGHSAGTLFYINAIERAASAIEMVAIGAKNVSLLVRQHLLASGVVDEMK